ncbi:COG4223 family protein [Kordiimonas aestuarii]|uniref:COG4223 family protein n=1 Tax=Kordiimonas aestuarii TaxID=1005925 RepID=UPI0021D0383E|nr:MICOS complex subunit MIC60 [Kordiimonas aestuarii]
MASEDQKPDDATGGDAGATEPSVDEKDIIDAEVIAEHEHPPREAETVKKGGSFMAKAGWVLAFGVSAFAAGVYFAPKFDPGLVYLGLKEDAVVPLPAGTASGPDGPDGPDMARYNAALETLSAALDRHTEILAQHEAALESGAAAREKLAADMALVAAADGNADAVPDPAAVAGLQADINRLTDDITRLSAMESAEDPQISKLSGALALARAESSHLKNRLESLETAMKAVESGALEASPRGRLVLSLGRLKDRALVGQPFGAELNALRADFSALPALDQQLIGADLAVLTEYGEGITPYGKLVSDFDAVAAAVMQASDSAEGNFLNKLFTVRRTDAGATGLDADLLRAERALAARNITGAADILAALEGPAKDTSAQWRKEARNHVAVTEAFDRLTRGVANAGTQERPAS